MSFMQGTIQAQDIQFSQFYGVPLYQNPAFAGSAHNPRAIGHQRIQWPGLDAKYLTSLASFDTYISGYNSGFGMMFIQDYQGASNISSTELSMQYAYEIQLNDEFTLRAGLQLAYMSRFVNYANLTFPQQFDNTGFLGGPNPYANNNQRRNFGDISSGGILYNKQWWFGFSGHHLNTPNQSFLQGASELPAKFAFTGGYKFYLKQVKSDGFREAYEVSITPTAHYKFQGKSDQFDVGIYGVYNKVLTGVWYRGIPFKRYNNFQNNESFIILMGVDIHGLTVAYSYDFVISKLTAAGTGGSHEFHISYIFQKTYKRKKPTKRNPCPRFHTF